MKRAKRIGWVSLAHLIASILVFQKVRSPALSQPNDPKHNCPEQNGPDEIERYLPAKLCEVKSRSPVALRRPLPLDHHLVRREAVQHGEQVAERLVDCEEK